MKKIILLFLIILLGIGYYFFSKTSKSSLGPIETIKENLSSSIKQTKNMGGELPFPLEVKGDFNIKLFSSLKDAPRVLAFDQNGVLFTSIPGEGKIVALPDKNNDGISDETIDVVTGLTHPHGIEFSNGFLYVGEENKLTRFKYDPASLKVSEKTKLFDIPGGGRHTTRTVKIYKDKLYVSVGSSCDVCIEKTNRADIWVSNLDGSNVEVYAKGLRNSVFFIISEFGGLSGTDMGRDFLGDNLPPDEFNLIERDGDYGWPYCYGDKIRDIKFKPNENMDYCDNTKSPYFKFPAHVAPLGLAFVNFPNSITTERGDVLVALHGSWNSSVPVGYKVVKVKNDSGAFGPMEDFITGFISSGRVLGRPVDLVFDKSGNLFVSDDKANNIYVVTPK